MPELPEVETTVRGLRKKVLQRSFLDVWTDHPKMVRFCFPKATIDSIKKKKIIKIWRRGKNIIFNFSDDISLLVHQKMTGHFLYGKWDFKNNKWETKEKGPFQEKINNYIHLMFFLDNNMMLALSDLRKFAKAEIWKKDDLEKKLKEIGPEPLSKIFNIDKFKERIKSKKGKIKQVLIDQEVIAGIGNIYSDEILWAAGVHPEKIIKNIKEEQFKRIFNKTKEILKKGIKLGGDSFSDYRNIDGEKGNFDKASRVYQKEGEKCYKCKSIIKRIKVGGRSSHFCPKCQKI